MIVRCMRLPAIVNLMAATLSADRSVFGVIVNWHSLADTQQVLRDRFATILK